MDPHKLGSDIGHAMTRGLLHGFVIAAKILWPYAFGFMALALAARYLSHRLQRSERRRSRPR